MSPVNIRSAAFPNVFLRMDGSGVTSFSASGGGTVNCQYTAGPWETFTLVQQPDGSFNIASVAFPNVFLRMDGSGVTSFSASGGGTVNCQYTAGPWEGFTLVQQGDGSVNIASVAFPNVFLRMDGNGVTSSSGSGGGKVNCQYTAGAWETFFLVASSFHSLGFNEEMQQQSSWCWAATTVSITRYYDPTTTWTQCLLANHVFSRNDCCANGALCNQGSDPGADLATVGHLASTLNGPATFATIMSEVDALRPIPILIQWNGSGAQHVPVIDGYDNSNPAAPTIEVKDPIYGTSMMVDFNSFPGNYHGGARWLYTYLTK